MSYEHSNLHVGVPCPSCSAQAHVVVNLAATMSHWCCVECGAIGVLPSAMFQPVIAELPVAVAQA